MALKIPTADLQELIVIQFGSQSNLARKMGLDDARMSKGLRSQSAKFMARLKKAGLKVDTLQGNEESGGKGTQAKMKALNERIIVLEHLLKEKDNVIEHQSNLLERYAALLGKPSKK